MTEPTELSGPTWYAYAKTLKGIKEVPGPKSNPTIMSWVKRAGAKILGLNYTNDDIPWCGVFMTEVFAGRGFPFPAITVRAKSWATWGTALDKTKPKQGAVLVFERKGGGHVGLCSGYVKNAQGKVTYYRVLGGNQNNSVNHTFIEASRCIAMRWPPGSTQVPQTALRFTDTKGGVSTNEE